MNANEYQKLAARTMPNPGDNVASALHGVLGLVSEKAEYFAATEAEHKKKELGDMWWMIAEICTANNIELEYITEKKGLEMDENEGLTIGLNDPVTRLCEIYQKRFQGHPVPLPKLVNILISITWALEILGVEFGGNEEVWKTNIAKLEARYPNGFEVERSLHRAEGDI